MYDSFCKLLLKSSDNEVDFRSNLGKFAGIVGIVLNLLLSGFKILVGFAFNSLSVIADGINNLSDASSSVIALLGFKLASKPADSQHPYGHARFEYLASLAIAIIILLLGINLVQSAIDKIINVQVMVFSPLTIAVLLVSIIVKLWMIGFYNYISKRIDSSTYKATAQDSFNDVITTSAVLICLVVGALAKINIDGYVSLAVSLFITYSGINLIIETTNPLLGQAPDRATVKAVEDKLIKYDGVLDFHDLLIHDYGPTRRFASVHVEMDSSVDVMICHDIIDNIERDFHKNGLHMVIHFDPINTADENVAALKEQVHALVKEIDPVLDLHDFRLVMGINHTNVIFDLVIPYEYNSSKTAAVKAQIQRKIFAIDPSYFVVIEVDKINIG